MKVAWILLFSLFLVFVLDESNAWGRFRVRIRARRAIRRITPRFRGRRVFRRIIPRFRGRSLFRRIIPRFRGRRLFRRILPRIRGRRLLRKIGRVIKSGFKKFSKIVVLANPSLFIAKKVIDHYKKYKEMKAKAAQGEAEEPTCTKFDICGGSCVNNKCAWHCDDICNVMADDKLIWPGELVELPCKFSEYDYTNSGHFLPADLAYHMNERGRECDNMMVFNMLDKDGDGKVTKAEFDKTKDHLLVDQDTC